MSSTNGKPEGIHVVGVTVENLHRLRVAQVKLVPGGRLVRVTGKNGAGKTSLLRSIREAIGGAGEVAPVAVNDESEDGAGLVRLELSNGFTVTRRFTAASEKGRLTVVGPDGGKHKQAKLNEWLGSHHDFDVLSFFDLKPDRQREILLGLGSDPELATKLEVARAAYRDLYDQRTPHISEQRRCRAVRAPEGERPEPVDTSAETERLGQLQSDERSRADVERRLQVSERAIEQAHDAHLDQLQTVERLKRELAEAQAESDRLESVERAAERERLDILELLAQTPSVHDEIERVLARLNEASSIERALQPWHEYERAQEALTEASAEVKRLSDAMAVAQEDEQRLIASAGIPVDGLTFDPETAEPLLQGRPLAIASGGERIGMAVAIAIAVNPDLRICLVDEANDLDLEALERLDELARQHGFQVWACRIGLESAGEIVVENGHAMSGVPA